MTPDKSVHFLQEIHRFSPTREVFDEHVEIVLQGRQRLVGDNGMLRHFVRQRIQN